MSLVQNTARSLRTGANALGRQGYHFLAVATMRSAADLLEEQQTEIERLRGLTPEQFTAEWMVRWSARKRARDSAIETAEAAKTAGLGPEGESAGDAEGGNRPNPLFLPPLLGESKMILSDNLIERLRAERFKR